ncbi:MAG: hypothetical protein PHP25_01350 [Candidatus Moranbacteria bacterium]|nr:hypothetical protein [Candidatus Moranbacteria bacterium]
METEKTEKKEKKSQTAGGTLQKIISVFSRWLFLVMIVISSAYAIFIWKKYIMNADWSEEKKRSYINEQSVLSFDEEKYKKAIEIRSSRREKLDNSEKFSGRDIFFPEGF